jgi:ribosome maturation factor RimP
MIRVAGTLCRVGLVPIFCFCRERMRHLENKLTSLARAVVEPMGYELVGVEHFQRGKGAAVLRVYIDHVEGGLATADQDRAHGVTLDDCSAVSHQLSGVLDVEDPIAGHYDLEVSSPGLDRPLFTVEHFRRFRGHKARLRLAAKLEGRRKLEGQIAGIEKDVLLLRVDGEIREIPLGLVEFARLVPEFRFGNVR